MTLGDRIVVMKDGLTQHIGTPLEVYHSPSNRFVAGFVGTPPMNFFGGELVNDGSLCFRIGSASLELGAVHSERIRGRTGPAVLGIRPEALSAAPEGRFRAARNALQVTVEVTEPLGEKMDVYATVQGGGRIVARLDSHAEIRSGMTVPIYIDISRVHVFDSAGSGAALS